MLSDFWTVVIYFASGLLSIGIIYFKQGRYLTDEQPFACIICGPLTLLMALILPASCFGSYEKAHPTPCFGPSEKAHPNK
jgi:hypothetical protein